MQGAIKVSERVFDIVNARASYKLLKNGDAFQTRTVHGARPSGSQGCPGSLPANLSAPLAKDVTFAARPISYPNEVDRRQNCRCLSGAFVFTG